MNLKKKTICNFFTKKYPEVLIAVLITGCLSCFLSGCGSEHKDDAANVSVQAQTKESAGLESSTASESDEETIAKQEETIQTETTVFELTRAEEAARSFGYEEGESVLKSPPEIVFQYSDGYFEYYTFTYAGKEFTVLHEYDNWQIKDSYRIRNSKDMELICRALIDIYPVHGRDNESYRTPEDMAYEWIQHNIVCELPEIDEKWLDRARNVDLDPDEQNMTLWEMYKANR